MSDMETTTTVLKRIRKIEIFTKNLVEEVFSGQYHSHFKGQGLEFAEVREYQSGDNYRDIDWNVTARQGIPYIKKYRETRELNILFIVDISASQNFGTREMLKKERMAEIAAVLSFSALSNQDKVGMLMFSDQVEKYLSPRKGRNNTLQIIRDILYLEPRSSRTSLYLAFEYALRLLKKRSVIFILSDFMDKGYEKRLEALASKHDVIAIQILDEAELNLPRAGVLRLKDPESGEEILVNSSDDVLRQKYQRIVINEQRALAEEMKRMNIDLLTIKSTEPYINMLHSFFARRKRRLRK